MEKDKSILICGYKNIIINNQINTMSERYTIKQLKEIYGVTERTLNNWVRTKGLPVTEITPQSKWVYKEDLENWENTFRKLQKSTMGVSDIKSSYSK